MIKHMTLSKRIGLGFSIVMLFIIILSITSYIKVNEIMNIAKKIITDQQIIKQDANIKKSIEKKAEELISFMAALSAMALLLSIFLSIIIIRSITKPLNKTASFINKISSDFKMSRRLDIKSNGEIGNMVNYINGLLENTQNVINEIGMRAIEISANLESVKKIKEGETLEHIEEQIHNLSNTYQQIQNNTLVSNKLLIKTDALSKKAISLTKVVKDFENDSSVNATYSEDEVINNRWN
jgi:methyl-accepting chemotaxis protein